MKASCDLGVGVLSLPMVRIVIPRAGGLRYITSGATPKDVLARPLESTLCQSKIAQIWDRSSSGETLEVAAFHFRASAGQVGPTPSLVQQAALGSVLGLI